jgi:hypothetical protein
MLDQRLKTRYELHLPFEIHQFPDRTKVTGLTSNVSGAGVLFTAPAPVGIGEQIQYSFKLPNPTGVQADVRVHCSGRVLRLEPDGFAASIDSYEIVRQRAACAAA